MVYNTWYDKSHWKGIHDQVGPMHAVINCAKALGLDLLPFPCDSQKETCPSFQIKVLCNAHCRRSGDRYPYPTEGTEC